VPIIALNQRETGKEGGILYFSRLFAERMVTMRMENKREKKDQ
jgi:hypothetical protein